MFPQCSLNALQVYLNECDNATETLSDNVCQPIIAQCPPGKHLVGALLERKCVSCPVNHYRSFTSSATACTLCPANSRGLITGADSIRICVCVPGWIPRYGSHESMTCVPCPTGSTCTNGEMVVHKGYWRKDRTKDQVYACSQRSFCKGEGGEEEVVGCSEGHEGPQCSQCIDGLALHGPTYKTCDKEMLTGATVALGVLALGVLAIWLLSSFSR